ncbi:MAG: protein-L-isoaspartate(D-aspartate) O-methyltransferase [Mariprofundaceae bacterium]|nr:protein-L-isoaspartate(D-aspartate) O-methyltransferase [Mariprofundaceae bacterium]
MTERYGFHRARQRMVEQQLCKHGIKDQRVLQAMRDIPRHQFVSAAMAAHAYQDSALPIGEGQTISQPYMVARMCELLNLRGNERVLEIGTGCGYHTAILAQLCARVYSIERIQSLYSLAKGHLRAIGQGNVLLKCADGLDGWTGFAPFDAIVVTAGGALSSTWLRQLQSGGVLLMPEGQQRDHRLVQHRMENGKVRKSQHDLCSFVPLRKGVQ